MEQLYSSLSTPPHIAILPTPGMGHLIPLIELAKRLHQRHAFTFTFIIPTDGSPMKAQRSVLQSLPTPSISSVFLPQVTFDDLDKDSTKIETIISLTVVRSLPYIRDAISDLAKSKRLVALVVDLFGTDGFDVAREFQLAPYIFFPSTATCLSLIFYLPSLDREVKSEFRDMPDLVRIPGALPLPGSELLDPVQDRTNDAYRWVLHHAKRYRLADGILVNSFMELETGPIRVLLEPQQMSKADPYGENHNRPPVYPVGPLIKMIDDSDSKSSDSSGCLTWLDSQPRGSVLYVSFGSGGTLSSTQVTELALGLEMSEQRFLWVVRSPNDKASNATYFSVHTQKDDPLEFLPRGFLDRTKDRGMVVPLWCPQAQVLSHEATGGFLTHCGWNSTLESVVNGVPLIAWPLYAEQKTNAFMLTHDVKIALRLKPESGSEGIISRDQISDAVKGLLEGEEGKNIRNRIKHLKEAAAAAIQTDGGSSIQALDEVALKWKNHGTNSNHP